jgi:hypothetical protein
MFATLVTVCLFIVLITTTIVLAVEIYKWVKGKIAK